ncbi:MAG: hypothetical protein MUC34_03790 [Anaerolineae bacterium]|nr:hypothetical protein [Anaerolineae bacterium]
MSKRGRAGSKSAASGARPAPPAAAPAAPITPTEPSRPWLIPTLVTLALLIVVGLGLAFSLTSGGPPQPPAAAVAAPTPGRVGPVDGCRAGPRFQDSLGLSDEAALTTALTNVKGLAIIDPKGNDGQGSIYRHESWDDAGFLGPFVTDRQGDIYVAPVPLVSLVDNPPELQNRVYRIGSDDEAMRLFVELPPAQPPGGGSPFGVVGLAYDCETGSLYATSLAGSTAGQEVGRIFQIDLATGNIVSQIEGVDAMGAAVYNTPAGKRLFFGLARSPEVRSVPLDGEGKFAGQPQSEFNYASHTLGGRRTARRIRFGDAGEMKLNMTDFNFSLQVASRRMEDLLTYRLDESSGKWAFDKIDPAR